MNLHNIVQISTESESQCFVGECQNDAHAFCIDGCNGYVECCKDHAPMALAEEISSGSIRLSPSMCPRCAGWTPFGGMSHVEDNRCDCVAVHAA